MNTEIKYRTWIEKYKEFKYWGFIDDMFISPPTGSNISIEECLKASTQSIGLCDTEDIDVYIGDILEFDNGDRIFIGIEEWLEPFAEGIGEYNCEDQWRDLYRIERAKIIGNIYKNPDLLK